MEDRMRFSVMAAMMDSSRGIGYKGKLPWPHIKKDYDYYQPMVKQRKDRAKKNIFIYGRLTWEATSESFSNDAATINIVVSKSLRVKPDHCRELATDFQSAVREAQKLYDLGDVENVWIIGGQRIYTEAVNHPDCEHVYLTRIYKEYLCDTFFPEFETEYEVVSESDIEKEVDGIELKFFVYKSKQ